MDLDLGLSGQIVTDGAGSFASLDFSGLDVDLAGMMLRLTITVDDADALGNLSFFLGVGGLANAIQWAFNISGTFQTAFRSGEQTVVTLQLSEIQAVLGTITLSSTGVPSVLAGFTDARLRATDDSSGVVTIDLHSVEVAQPTKPGAYVSITFDDGRESVTSLAYPKMAELGFRGTEYPIVGTVGTADHVTLADLQQRHAQGWEIAGHAATTAAHIAPFTALTAAEVTAELATNIAWLQSNFPHDDGHTFAYPRGAFDETTDAQSIEALVTAAGFTAGRSTLSNPGSTTHLQIESLPPPISTRLYGAGVSEVSAGQQDPANLLAAGGVLDKLESNGGWLILVFHVITVGAASTATECSQADFDAIMDDLAARNITVLPVRDVLAHVADPAENPAAAASDQDDDETGFTNTAYVAGDALCGVPFVAPRSGRVMVLWSGRGESNTPDVRVLVSSRVASGAALGAGTTVYGATDMKAVESSSDAAGGPRSRVQAGMWRYIKNLKPGGVYHAHTMHRLSAAGTGDIFDRSIMVVPLP